MRKEQALNIETMEPLIVLSASVSCGAFAEFASVGEPVDLGHAPSCCPPLDCVPSPLPPTPRCDDWLPQQALQGCDVPVSCNVPTQVECAPPEPACGEQVVPPAVMPPQDYEMIDYEMIDEVNEPTTLVKSTGQQSDNPLDDGRPAYPAQDNTALADDTVARDTVPEDTVLEDAVYEDTVLADTELADSVADEDSIRPRQISGLGNNELNPELGSAGENLLRLGPGDFSRLDDPELPSAREVSNQVSAATEPKLSARGLSDFIWAWGQFVDHDLSLTKGGSSESANIAVPEGDRFFDPNGTGVAEISLTRSAFELDAAGTPQQENLITSFVDASQVYGSDDELALRLREGAGGMMRVSAGDLLPLGDTAPGQPLEVLAGDVRAGENVALNSMHALFVREHNRLAGIIAADEYADADLSDAAIDEAIYQRARTIVAAQIQHITYTEFLPALLGEHALSEYQGYDPSVNPGVSNEFATAAFRFGHTTLSSEFLRLDEHGNEIPQGSLLLRDAFFQPEQLQETGVDPILRGLAAQVSQEVDTEIIDDLRNFLFGQPGSGGFDLASLNIQRGRDHGIADYNSVRESLGLDAVHSFSEITSDADLAHRLEQVYGHVDNVDLWVGGLAEDHVDGGSLGETFSAVLVDQFERTRAGDRFWYENSLSAEDLASVKSLKLSDIIRLNSSADLQANVFFAEPPVHGSRYV